MMLKNYFQVAFRNFLKERYYTLINISGLAIGLATSMLILVFVHFQLSYDQSHPDHENLYRVNQTAIWDPNGGVMASTPIPLAQVLVQDYPEIEASTRVNTMGTLKVIHEENGVLNKIYMESDLLAADSNFFDFFSFKLVEGNAATALEEMNSVVLSQEAAEKYFGNRSALGKILLIGEERIPVKVTGVTANQPENIHFGFDFLFSMHTNPNIKRFEWSWIWTQVATYVRVREDTDIKELESKFSTIAGNHAMDAFKRLQIDFEEFEEENGKLNFYLQPVSEIHLYSAKIGNRLGPVSDISYIYIFGIIGVFIIIIAAINFTNLSTARSVVRAKEIGVRKVLGSDKSMLVTQYLMESVMMAVIAAFFSYLLIEIIDSSARGLIGIDITEHLGSQNLLIGAFILIPFILGILAGFYPALYMTRFKPSEVLKGKLSKGMKGNRLRNVLVVFQFSISIILMISSIMVYQQLVYFQDNDMGFERENLMIINYAEKLENNLDPFLNEVRNSSLVSSAGLAFSIPGRGSWEDFFHESGNESDEIPMSNIKIDEDFIPTMKMEMLVGRNFSKDNPEDVNNVIINETAMRQFGWTKDDVLGREIAYYEELKFKVIGVVKDFNYVSMRYRIAPLGYFHLDGSTWGDMRSVAVKYNPENITELIPYLEETWDAHSAGTPFDYSFLDEELNQLYTNEQRTARLFGVFTIIAIVVACIGLFGLSSYTIEQRKKEIGIRKVLGSSVKSVVLLLNRNYTYLVLAGFALAIPLAWYGMDKWLQQFTYRIEINIWTFLISGALALLIMWLTVGFHCLKAANANPVDALKDE